MRGRPVVALHQVEVTNRCNLACVWCPNRLMRRPRVDMDRDTFRAALQLAKFYVQRGTQDELNLGGTGEPTLHVDFSEYVALARQELGSGVRLIFATNGIALDAKLLHALAPSKPVIWISPHLRTPSVLEALRLCSEYGLLGGVSTDPETNPNNWAGQVAWASRRAQFPCPWQGIGWGMVLSNGDVTRCCLDYEGTAVLGTVHEAVTQGLQFATAPFELCSKCYQYIEG